MRLLRVAVIIALALNGVSKADSIINVTLTGAITPNPQDGSTSDGLDLFGGGNLDGAAVTVTFSYDIDALQTAAANGTDYSYYAQSSVSEVYADETSDGAVSESITIDSQTFTISNTVAGSDASVENSHDGAPTIGTYVGTPTSGVNSLELGYFGNSGMPFGQLGNSTALQNFFTGTVTGDIIIYNTSQGRADYLGMSVTTALVSPEPTTWGLVATGLGAMAFLKRRRFSEST